MRILLDECLPRKFKRVFAGHECATVAEAGFAGETNGGLLALAEAAGFDVLITLDRGIEFQQRIRGRAIGVVLLRARSNRLSDLTPLADACRAALEGLQAGEIWRV